MPDLSAGKLSEMTNVRRNVIAGMVKSSMTLSQIAKALSAGGIVNPKTSKPYSRQTLRADIHEARLADSASGKDSIKRAPLSEVIGRYTYVKPQWNARVLLNLDSVWTDYIFYDALRRGLAIGYEISGPAFCLPAAQTTASYVFGRGINAALVESSVSKKMVALNEAVLPFPIREANGQPTQSKRNAVTGNKKSAPPLAPLQMQPKAKPSPSANDPVAWTNLQIKSMLERNQAFLLTVVVDTYCLGNQYVIVNPDCTFSVASPETVTVEYSASDYRRVERVIIRTKMQNARTEDVYTAEKRTLTVNYYDGKPPIVYEYENLIGRIPIIHFTNDRSANEVYGHPIYEGALPVMARYDDLIKNMLEGVNLISTPIPMFYGLDNPGATKRENSTAVQYTDAQGNVQTEYQMRLDKQTGLFIGKGGDGKMLAPQVGFTKDSLDALRQLFLLMLNETHIPELIWGGAISSSKASAESQMPPFIQYIQYRRLMLEGQGAEPALSIEARGGLLELIDVWLRMYKLLNPTIVVGPVQMEWPEIDMFGDQWKYMWGTYFNSTGKITDESALKMSGYFLDPAGEVMKAAGKKPRPPSFDEYEAKLRRARLEAGREEMQPPDGGEHRWASDYGLPELDYLYARMGPGNTGGVNSTLPHEHFDAQPSADEWSVLSPLGWIGMFGGHNG